MTHGHEHKAKEIQKKGEDTMSAYAQNYAYIFGKKKPGVKEPVMSPERMAQIKESAKRFLPKDKDK